MLVLQDAEADLFGRGARFCRILQQVDQHLLHLNRIEDNRWPFELTGMRRTEQAGPIGR